MANILFKRGVHSALPTKAVDGAFYLTTDSHRLYAGIGEELVDLNKYIRTYANLQALQADWANAQLGDFAYLDQGNILAVFKETESGNKWVQINETKNTTLSTFTATGDGNTDPGTLTLTIVDSDGKSLVTSIEFIGTKGTDVTVDEDGNVTVEGCAFTLGGDLAEDNSSYDINLTSSNEDEVASSKVTLVAGNNVTFSEDDDGSLIINAKDTTLAKNNADGKGPHTFTADDVGGAKVVIEDTAGNKANAILEPHSLFYKVGKNEDISVDNQNALPVYTITEIDKMFAGLNPMRYMDTVDGYDEGSKTLAGWTNVERGDTYMASQSFDIKAIVGGTEPVLCKAGDLFIATGTENDEGILTTVVWTYIPAGDDSQTDTTYEAVVTAADNAISLKSSGGATVHKIDLDAGEDGKITLTSTSEDGGKTLKTVIGHAAPGAADATKQSTDSAETASYNSTNKQYNFNNGVSSIAVDATGHVSSVKSNSISIPAPILSGDVVAVANNTATITTTLKDNADNNLGAAVLKIDASANDNLNVTGTGNTVSIQLEWGTFD